MLSLEIIYANGWSFVLALTEHQTAVNSLKTNGSKKRKEKKNTRQAAACGNEQSNLADLALNNRKEMYCKKMFRIYRRPLHLNM